MTHLIVLHRLHPGHMRRLFGTSHRAARTRTIILRKLFDVTFSLLTFKIFSKDTYNIVIAHRRVHPGHMRWLFGNSHRAAPTRTIILLKLFDVKVSHSTFETLSNTTYNIVIVHRRVHPDHMRWLFGNSHRAARTRTIVLLKLFDVTFSLLTSEILSKATYNIVIAHRRVHPGHMRDFSGIVTVQHLHGPSFCSNYSMSNFHSQPSKYCPRLHTI